MYTRIFLIWLYIFLYTHLTIPTLQKNTECMSQLLISISTNVPLFLKCSNNERGKQMRLTYETRLEYLCMNDSLRI